MEFYHTFTISFKGYSAQLLYPHLMFLEYSGNRACADSTFPKLTFSLQGFQLELPSPVWNQAKSNSPTSQPGGIWLQPGIQTGT